MFYLVDDIQYLIYSEISRYYDLNCRYYPTINVVKWHIANNSCYVPNVLDSNPSIDIIKFLKEHYGGSTCNVLCTTCNVLCS